MNSTVLKNRWLPLILILAVYVPLVLWYSAVVPIFEAPDESSHYKVAYFLASTGRLPVLDYATPGEEEHQPPLYYVLVAPVLRLVDAGDGSTFMVRNPHAGISAVESFGNKNVFLHGAPAEKWPFRDVPLAVHLARLVSVAFGVLTIVATYFIGRAVFGDTRLWLAAAPAALVAFTPQFVFISGSINNDSAIAGLSALVLWLVLANFDRQHSWKWLVALGIMAGLASLSKAAGLASIGLVVAGLIVKSIRVRNVNRVWQEIVVVLVVSALVSGWWFARNWVLYDDPLLARYITRWFSGQPLPPDAVLLLRRFWQSVPSYWGVFGWLNIGWPEWVYYLLRLATAAAGLGMVVFLIKLVKGRVQDINRFALGLTALWTILALAAISRWIMIAGGLQGRLLFPAISSLSVLMVLGWSSLVPSAWQTRVLAMPIAGLLGLALATPLGVLAPAYAPPKVLNPNQLPGAFIPTSLRINDSAELIGYRAEPPKARAGDVVDIVLYWRTIRLVEDDFSVFVTLLDQNGEELGRTNSYPGLGNFPTSRWQEGQVIEDIYPVRIDPALSLPTLASISVGWFDTYGRNTVSQVDPQGYEISVIGKVKLTPAQWPADPQTRIVAFGDQIRLARVDIVTSDLQTVRLDLEWVSQAKPPRDYTIFAHVVDGQGKILSQYDQPPLAGGYPTSAWEPGEVIRDSIAVPLPTGPKAAQAAQVKLGLYDPSTGKRLPVLDKSGQVVGDSVTLPIPIQ